jgi:hypothetical protein
MLFTTMAKKVSNLLVKTEGLPNNAIINFHCDVCIPASYLQNNTIYVFVQAAT